MRFLTRFQRLERARAGPGPARSATGDRFEALEPAAPLPETPSAPLDRFVPPASAPLELQPRSEAQPFVRCVTCGADSAVGTRRCQCGAALDTIEVVSFNAELWDRHRAEQLRLDADQERLRSAQLAEARMREEERRALGEAIAREIATRERGTAPVSTLAGALLLLGFLALVLLPRGPLARLVFAVLLGAVAVRGVVAWARSRNDLSDDPTVRH